MASTDDTSLGSVRRVVISDDVMISEKRGMSKARDPKTGLLLPRGDRPTPSLERQDNDTSEGVRARARRLWRKRATPPAAPPR